MSDVTSPALTSFKAVLALVLGLLALPLLITTGLPALIVGFLALREINESDGRLGGRRLAVAGMVLGGLGTLTVVVWAVAVGLLHLRELNYRTVCQNNLRTIGLAVNLYYDKHQSYPAGTVPNEQLRPEQRLSWLTAILPYLPEEPRRQGNKPKEIHDAINFALAWDAPANEAAVAPALRWFLCPTDPGTSLERRPGQTSYVGIAGVGAEAAELPASDPRAGVFGYDRRITRADVTAGLSPTMLTTETARDNGPWAAGGHATLRAVLPDERPYIGPGRPFGGCHPGGLNVLFLDGHADFIKDTLPPAKFEVFATIANDLPPRE